MKRSMRFGMIGIGTVLLVLLAFQNCGLAKSKTYTANRSSVTTTGANGELIKGFSPASMYRGGGTLTVSGDKFTSATEVFVNSMPCMSLQLVSPGQITCEVPPLSVGTYAVEVAGSKLPLALKTVDFSQIVSVAGRNGEEDNLDGVGHLARFTQIGGMTSDGANMYIADYKLSTIRQMNLNTFNVTTIAGVPSVDPSYQDGVGKSALFANPQGMAYKDGFLYIGDTENCSIRKMEIATGIVTTLLGVPPHNYTTNCAPPLDGIGGAARLGKPEVLIFNGSDLYSAESVPPSGDAHIIRKINVQTLEVTTVAGGNKLPLTTDTLYINRGWWAPLPEATTTEVDLPSPAPNAIAVLQSAHPYAAAEVRGKITQTGATGIRIHFTQLQMGAGAMLSFSDSNDEGYLELKGDLGTDFWSPVFPLSTVKIDFTPGSAATAAFGFKIDKFEYTTAANLPLSHSFDGPALATPIGPVDSMAVSNDMLYFTDDELGMVRKLDLKAATISGVLGGEDDGSRILSPYNLTQFSAISGLAVDSGYLYVSDSLYDRVVRMDLGTRDVQVLSQSDPNAGASANVDGPIATASVYQPGHLFYDPLRGLFLECVDVIRQIK